MTYLPGEEHVFVWIASLTDATRANSCRLEGECLKEVKLPHDFGILEQQNRTRLQSGRRGLGSSHKSTELDVGFQARVPIENDSERSNEDSVSDPGGNGRCVVAHGLIAATSRAVNEAAMADER
jgi:hypothetical protein